MLLTCWVFTALRSFSCGEQGCSPAGVHWFHISFVAPLVEPAEGSQAAADTGLCGCRGGFAAPRHEESPRTRGLTHVLSPAGGLFSTGPPEKSRGQVLKTWIRRRKSHRRNEVDEK